ncbi:MAG TPA: CpsB/CapC family capsule biosynthesis tyrosine phosphatase [Solirubrobacteraceae bacterium]|nr:CpsB/CapC family capsule biosynthesis tyrosine phosphatase [Solirubrobacteraceae bacterium]
MPYVDLHLHLLPGVDDGPRDTAASLTYAERLAADGVHEATVTPHVGHPDFPLDVASIPERTRALQAEIARAGIRLRLHAGGEIHPDGATSLLPADLDLIAHGPAGARWVLLEVPFDGIDAAFLHACRHVRIQGFGLVIAHPERARGFSTSGFELLRAELAEGALLQVSVCSLLGRHGADAQGAAGGLIRAGLAYVIASDGHGGRRGHTLRQGTGLARAVGASAVQSSQLTHANPRFLLDHGIPRRPSQEDRMAWRSPHQRRMTAALTAARRRR